MAEDTDKQYEQIYQSFVFSKSGYGIGALDEVTEKGEKELAEKALKAFFEKNGGYTPEKKAELEKGFGDYIHSKATQEIAEREENKNYAKRFGTENERLANGFSAARWDQLCLNFVKASGRQSYEELSPFDVESDYANKLFESTLRDFFKDTKPYLSEDELAGDVKAFKNIIIEYRNEPHDELLDAERAAGVGPFSGDINMSVLYRNYADRVSNGVQSGVALSHTVLDVMPFSYETEDAEKLEEALWDYIKHRKEEEAAKSAGVHGETKTEEKTETVEAPEKVNTAETDFGAFIDRVEKERITELAEDAKVASEKVLEIADNLRKGQKANGIKDGEIMDKAAYFYALAAVPDYKIKSEEEQKAIRDDLVAKVTKYEKQKALDAEDARDRQIAGIWKDFGLKVAAGMDPKKAQPEALADFFTKNKITDPKEQAAWKKDFETYFARKAEKEKAAADAHKKSGKKVLENGVVSKWLSRNKDKLIGGAAATLGAAWTASASLSAAGMGGLGLLPTIQILGVSSTVFPPVLAVGAAVVATAYLLKAYNARKAEKEAEKGKTGEKTKGSFLDHFKRGGRS